MLRLVLLVLSNVTPSLLTLMDKRWDLAPLVFCAGNGLWIAHMLTTRASRSGKERLASVCGLSLIMTVGALSWGWLSEPMTTLNGGLGWDGLHYAAIYSHFSGGDYTPIVPQFPYVQRVGLPFLAAHVSLPPREAFFLLHALFWSATILLFAACCRTCFGLTSAAIQFGVLWLQVLWLSIPRGAASYSFTVDSAALFFMQAWIFLLLCGPRAWLLLPICAFIGVLFKETILLLVLLSYVALVAVWTTPRWKRALPPDLSAARPPLLLPLALAGLAAMIAKWMASHALPHGGPVGGSEWQTMMKWLGSRVEDPFQLLRYLAAAFAAYGGFALISAAALGTRRGDERRWTLTLATVLCPLYFAVCFVAGSDLTRFAFMAFPFALPVLLTRFDEVLPQLAVLAFILGIPAAHAFTPIPSPLPGHLVPMQDLEGVYSWMMEYAHPAIVGSWMAWWLGCILLLRTVGFSRTWQQANVPSVYSDQPEAIT